MKKILLFIPILLLAACSNSTFYDSEYGYTSHPSRHISIYDEGNKYYVKEILSYAGDIYKSYYVCDYSVTKCEKVKYFDEKTVLKLTDEQISSHKAQDIMNKIGFDRNLHQIRREKMHDKLAVERLEFERQKNSTQRNFYRDVVNFEKERNKSLKKFTENSRRLREAAESSRGSNLSVRTSRRTVVNVPPSSSSGSVARQGRGWHAAPAA